MRLSGQLHPAMRPAPVIVAASDPELELRFGVQSTSYQGDNPPTACGYILTYTARRGWDIVPYLKFVELTVTQGDGTMVGHSVWRHRGGFGFNKWAASRGKIESAVDGLLARPS